jgi:hypothetical protein
MFAPEDQRSTMMAEEGDEGLEIKGVENDPVKDTKNTRIKPRDISCI